MNKTKTTKTATTKAKKKRISKAEYEEIEREARIDSHIVLIKTLIFLFSVCAIYCFYEYWRTR